MSVIHAPRKPDLDVRMLAFPTAMGGALLLLFLRLWYIQVVRSQELVERANATRKTPLVRPAPRGLIFDRNNVMLAGVKPEIAITAIYSEVNKHPAVLPKLAQMLGVDFKKLKSKFEQAKSKPGLPVPIYVGASLELGTRIAEASDDLPGIGVDTVPMRYYPDTTSFTHILGYVRIPDDKDVDRIKALGRDPAQYVGKGGVERAFETELMGVEGGEQVETDAKRRPIRVVSRDVPTPGNQLVLSVDSQLQRIAAKAMTDRNFVGAVVALDPSTGEVLCMVSTPTYDQQVFQGGASPSDVSALLTDERRPMQNRAIGSSYSPGSTFKVVTSLAAYETGRFNIHESRYCPGYFKIGKSKLRCLGHHGSISFETAMAKSCNTYFGSLGFDVGPAALRRAAAEVGLGDRTGLDFGREVKGLVPTDEWFKKRFKKAHWYDGDTVNFSIGQGFLRTTPLQMANLAAMVGNGGVNYRPHMVRAVRNPQDGKVIKQVQPEVLHKVDAPDFWAEMKTALVGVIQHGTGGRAGIPNVTWAGKTGSTEHGNSKHTHGWFMGFAPYDNPKIAIAVLIEDAGHGGDIAAPVAKEVVQAYLAKLSKPAKAAENAAPASSASVTPLPSPAAR